jgi:hypothetical protein
VDADIGRLLDEATAIKEPQGLDVPVDVVATCLVAIPMIVSRISELPASRGYEPMLVEAGWDPVWARGMAALLVRHGKRRARESSWKRPVFDAIRFLAQRERQTRAILPRSKLLLDAWKETSIIETSFDDAGVRETEFITLLESAVTGGDVGRKRITEIAAAVLPVLSLKRGPKISAPSAAYEFFLENTSGSSIKRCPRSRRNRGMEYVGPLTEATRREFRAPNFDSRPAHRRRIQAS